MVTRWPQPSPEHTRPDPPLPLAQASPHSILDMDGLGAPHKLPPPQHAPHGKPHGALHATHRKGMPHPPFKAKQRLFPAAAAALVRE